MIRKSVKLTYYIDDIGIFLKQIEVLNDNIRTIVATKVSSDFRFSLLHLKFMAEAVIDYAKLVEVAERDPDYNEDDLPKSMLQLCKSEKEITKNMYTIHFKDGIVHFVEDKTGKILTVWMDNLLRIFINSNHHLI